MSRILLIEDDVSLGATLTERLTTEGYEIAWAKNKSEAQQQAKTAPSWDALILDIGLPDGNGLDLLRDGVFSSFTPIIFLTAMNSAENRLEGFELGAADFIPKPFHLKELLLRIERVIKKRSIVEVEDFSILKEQRAIRYPNGEIATPSNSDFELLCLLLENAPKILSREEIIVRLYGLDGATPRTIDNAIVRLRQLLAKTGKDRIRSVRGLGYQWI